jgi:hypothetical protein
MRSYAYPSGGPPDPADRAPTSRELLGLALGLAGTAASITVMYLAMYAVMGVGGACADGNSAYQITVHCPDGAGVGLTLGIFALMGFWAITARYGPRVGGFWASAPVFPWTGLFVGLGWNFLQAGLQGDLMGWLLGAMFWAMGLVPMIAVVAGMLTGNGTSGTMAALSGRRGYSSYGESTRRAARSESATPSDGPADFERTVFESPARFAPTHAATDAHAVRMQLLASIDRDLAAVEVRSANGVTIMPGEGADAGQDTQALLGHLEQLANLRREDLLTEAEYETAKSAIVKALEGIR